MENVRRSQIKYPGINISSKKSREECPRLIIIDGANIIQKTGKSQEGKFTLSGLISLIRFLTIHGFETVVSLQRKYMKQTSTFSIEAVSMLKALYRYNIVVDVPVHSLDDLMMLELARTTNGVVASGDRFRDHVDQFEGRFNDVIMNNSTTIDAKLAPETLKNSFTSDGHYIASHIFDFSRPDILFSTPDNPVHELSTERRLSFTKGRQTSIVSLCDKMLETLRTMEVKSIPPPPPLPLPVITTANRQSSQFRTIPAVVRRLDTGEVIPRRN